MALYPHFFTIIIVKRNTSVKRANHSSRGGFGVERLLFKKCHSALLDHIPIGETIPAVSMFYV